MLMLMLMLLLLMLLFLIEVFEEFSGVAVPDDWEGLSRVHGTIANRDAVAALFFLFLQVAHSLHKLY